MTPVCKRLNGGTEIMRSAIYGAGSLGTVMGAFLAKNGVDIDLVNRNKAHKFGSKDAHGDARFG